MKRLYINLILIMIGLCCLSKSYGQSSTAVSMPSSIVLHQKIDTLDNVNPLPSNPDSLMALIANSSRTLSLAIELVDTTNIFQIHFRLGTAIGLTDIVADSLALNPLNPPSGISCTQTDTSFLLELGQYSAGLEQYFLQVWLEDNNHNLSLIKVVYNN